jgi:phage tail protein X
MTKAIGRLTTATAVLAAALCLQVSTSHAGTYGDAPWCAVLQIGTGSVTWHCYYRTVEECVPNVLAGNRGSCNLNPYFTASRAPATTAHPAHHKRQHG